jgi:hypothetical protein
MRTYFATGLAAVSLMVATCAFGEDQKSVPDLSTELPVLTVAYPSESVSGKITLRESATPLSGMKLQAEPLKNGENTADVHFPLHAQQNSVELEVACPKYSAEQPCVIDFEISPVRATGNYQGVIDLKSGDKILRSLKIVAVRPDPLFQPAVGGDLVKNNSIQFDATDATWFVVTIQNPTGSPWRRFKVRDCSDEQATARYDPSTRCGGRPGAGRRKSGTIEVPSYRADEIVTPISRETYGTSTSIAAEVDQIAMTLTIPFNALKSSGLRVYRGKLLAAAVEAISKSAKRERLDCLAARAAANMRPYTLAPSSSKGIGSHVAVAHCSRSCRRARSSLLSVA